MANLVSRASTFDDWVDLFRQWQNDIGLDRKDMERFTFETKFGELPTNEIQFGHWAGQPKWQKVLHIPDQRVRDALLHLIIYQGDTEFASVEQQRNLLVNAPYEYDFHSLLRVMCEEMRHGWQMSYLLIDHFGTTGKIEAQKLLERRADEQERLLGSFNESVDHFLDFYTYTEFIDRDGKFQLTMLSNSGFEPLARSMFPMLREEAYHLLTGNTGLMRILKAGRIPVPIVQKYFNKWVPTAYDLFGGDHSSTARWAYIWGLKGRYDELENSEAPDLDNLNDLSRNHYFKEVDMHIQALNRLVGPDGPRLTTPSIAFNRKIGRFRDKCFDLGGNEISKEEFEKRRGEFFPTPEDEALLADIFKEEGWIVPVQTGAR